MRKPSSLQQVGIRFGAVAFAFSLVMQPAKCEPAAGATPETVDNDMVLRAMTDELQRNAKNLHIDHKATPYFIGYRVTDDKRIRITYELGQKAEHEERQERLAQVNLHAGDRKFDNTADLVGRRSRNSNSRFVVSDENYPDLRRDLWVMTDDAYKDASEDLEKQETYKKGHIIRNLCESMSPVDPSVHLDPVRVDFPFVQDWDKRLKQLSQVFDKYPTIRKSWVVMEADQQVDRVANTEGTRVRFNWTPMIIGITAFARCPDGEDIWDCEYIRVVNENDVPPQEELEARARALADKLVQYQKAERKNYYFGPILFEDQAAVELVEHGIAPKLVATPGDNIHPSGTLIRCVNTRILPKFINISDDPMCTIYGGTPIPGPYLYDDEGTPCKKVTLVEKGFLKELLSSRTPVLPGQKSNGHNFNDAVAPTTLIVNCDKTVPLSSMKAQLLKLAKEHGLKEAVIARRIVPATARVMHGDMDTARNDSIDGCQPLALYSVDVATGKETPIRGLRFHGFGLGTMQNIIAAGNDAKAYNTVNWSGYVRSIVTPSFLVDHMEMEEDGRDTLSPYPLENPYFAAK